VVFGAGLNFLTMSFGASLPPVPLIQVDSSRANIGRYSHADVAVVGDAKLAADAILAALPPGENAEQPFRSEEVRGMLAAFDIDTDFQPANTPRTVDMHSLGAALNKLLPEQKNIVYDAGNFLGILPYLSVPGPGHFKMTSEFASIGLGFGTALGVARGRPDIPTVLVIGDGGLLMTMGELETVVREDIPLVIIVMNDWPWRGTALPAHAQPAGRKSAFPTSISPQWRPRSGSRLGRSARWRTCKPRRPCCAARKARCSWTAS
jgi:thiamine pyrophosphate-dependent acetolactate synthase large subunit-like protein